MPQNIVWFGLVPITPFKSRYLDSEFGLRYTDYHSASAGQLFVGDLGDELQAEAETPAFLTGRLIEKVDNVSAKSVLGSTALVEVKRAD